MRTAPAAIVWSVSAPTTTLLTVFGAKPIWPRSDTSVGSSSIAVMRPAQAVSANGRSSHVLFITHTV